MDGRTSYSLRSVTRDNQQKGVRAYQARTPFFLREHSQFRQQQFWVLTRVLALQASPSGFALAPCRAHLPGALRIARGSTSPEYRLSAFVERGHPFPAVFGGDQAVISLDLERQAVPH